MSTTKNLAIIGAATLAAVIVGILIYRSILSTELYLQLLAR